VQNGTASARSTRPVLYINLTDSAGTFANKWFFAANNCKSQMLTVAVAALGAHVSVAAILDPPNSANSPFTKIYRLYMNAS
jgi:uncharacterized membrane protein YadS